MAQGCNLIFSKSDKDHFPLGEHSLRTREEIAREYRTMYRLPLVLPGSATPKILGKDAATNISVAKAWGISQKELERFEQLRGKLTGHKQLKQFLTDFAASNPHLQRDMVKGLANKTLPLQTAVKTTRALRDIHTRTTSSPAGLRNVLRRLRSGAPGHANGAAAEVIFASKVLQGEAQYRLPSATEVELVLGDKQQASYGAQRVLKGTDFEKHETILQAAKSTGNPEGARKTVEADNLFSVFSNGQPEYRISFDYKYRSKDQARVEESQLQGVAMALMSGSLDEAHFASNRDFDKRSYESLAAANEQVKRHAEETGFDVPEICFYANEEL